MGNASIVSPRQKKTWKKYRSDYFGRLTPANILDWLIVTFLGGILGYASMNLGGYHPRAGLVLSWMIGGLLGLHGLGLRLRQQRPLQIHPAGLLFLPFLVYAAFSCLYLTPIFGRAEEEVLILAQGLIVYWVATHHLRRKAQIWGLLFVLVGLGLVSLAWANAQYSFNPSWLSLGQDSLKPYEGKISGPLSTPGHFGMLMGILIATLLVITFTSKLPLLLRLFCGYCALLCSTGLISFGNRGNFWGMVGILLVFPYFVTKKIALRSMGFLGMAGVATLLYVYLESSEAWVDPGSGESETTVHRWMRQAAWDIFEKSPIWGSGVASYEIHFEQVRMPEAQINPRYAHNDYLNTLSDFGLAGFILFFGPLTYLMLYGWRRWRQLPFFTRLKRKRPRVACPEKLFLGIGLLSLIGLGIQLWTDFPLKVPALLYTAAILLGLITRISFSHHHIALRGRLTPTLWLGLCLLLGGLMALQGTVTYRAGAHYEKGKERLEHFIENIHHLRYDRPTIEAMIFSLEQATTWNPRHALAWSDLSLALLQTYYLEPDNFRAIGRQAQEKATRAMALHDELWPAYAHYGMALLMEARPHEEARPYFEKIVALSPTNPATWNYYAKFLSLDRRREKEALEAVNRALALDPKNRRALELRDKLLLP